MRISTAPALDPGSHETLAYPPGTKRGGAATNKHILRKASDEMSARLMVPPDLLEVSQSLERSKEREADEYEVPKGSAAGCKSPNSVKLFFDN
jgi:hypothetical protein